MGKKSKNSHKKHINHNPQVESVKAAFGEPKAKEHDKKDFIIYFLYFFIDITLIYLIVILILRNFPSV